MTDDVAKIAAALCAGYAAFALAVGVGIPVWTDWPSWEVPADATDIGVLVFFGVLHTIRAHLKGTPNE
jgi:drug/metabolite transporter (DMT)-like permease